MLLWIHSIHRVHHRSSHEYLRVVTVREEGKGETAVTTPIDYIGFHVFILLHDRRPMGECLLSRLLIVLSSVV
jgi:hypothetical protein